MRKIIILLSLFPAYACSSNTSTSEGTYDGKEDSTVTSTVIIDLNKTYQKIDNQFYGSHVDNYSELPSKEFIDELQLGKIRIGGNDFDIYNWKLGLTVNNKGEVKSAYTLETLSGDMRHYNIKGIFQINLTGYQPEKKDDGSFVVNRSFTPEEAYLMIKDLNGKKRLGIENVSLGNEFSSWFETHQVIFKTEDAIRADEYIERYIQYAIAVRKAQEEVNGNPNSIKIWGPEMTSSWYDWNTGNISNDCKWSDVKGQLNCSYGNGKFDNFIPYFLQRLKLAENDKTINPRKYKLLDFFSIHYYPNFRTKINDPASIIKDESNKQLVASMLESTRIWNDPSYINTIDISSYRNKSPNILNRMKGWLAQYYPDAKLAINEFAVDSDYRTNGYHPMVRPLYMADSIGIFAKEGVSFFNQFQLSVPAESELPWSLIEGGSRMDLFHMYKLFTNHFKGTIVDAKDNMGDEINAYASTEGNDVNLILVNKSPVERKTQIYIKEFFKKKLATYVIPGWSTAVLKLNKKEDGKNKKFAVYEFGAKEMGVTLDRAYQKQQ